MAKFKPGDKVRYLIGTDKDKSKVHTVLETTIEGGREMVWFDDDGRGGNGIWADSLVKVNSRARNAKFKVGDVVSVKREAAEMIDNPALARKRGRVTKVLPGGYYEVDGELGATGLELTDAELTLANSRACNGVRSRNAVVAKALNACGTVRNASKSKVKITIKSVTDKGSQTFEKTIDADSLETWMRSAGIEGEYQRVLKQLATEGVQSVPLSVPIRISITSL